MELIIYVCVKDCVEVRQLRVCYHSHIWRQVHHI